jgi:hypothetical protein
VILVQIPEKLPFMYFKSASLGGFCSVFLKRVVGFKIKDKEDNYMINANRNPRKIAHNAENTNHHQISQWQ